MAFDPDAYLATDANQPRAVPSVYTELAPMENARAAFDPDAYISQSGTGVSEVESFFRGAGQTVSFGFSDEIAGGFGSLFSGEDYGALRDESRAANQRAEEINPNAYLGGQIAGIAPTLLLPGGAASVAGRIGIGALEGGVAGLGFSTADTMGDVARDIAIGSVAGGLGGAATAGIGAGVNRLAKKLAQGAPNRAKERILAEVTGTTNPAARNKLLGHGGKNGDRIADTILKDDDLFYSHRNPTEFLEVVKRKIDDVGAPLDQMYAQSDKLSPGLDANGVLGVLDGFVDSSRKAFRNNVARTFENTAKDIRNQLFQRNDAAPDAIRAAIKAVGSDVAKGETKLISRAVKYQLDTLNDAVKTFGDRAITPGRLDELVANITRATRGKVPDGIADRIAQSLDDVAQRATQSETKHITASQMRQLVRGLQEDAFTGSVVDPTPIKRALRELTDNLRGKLNDHVEGVIGNAGIKPTFNGAPTGIKELNTRMSDLINLSRVAERSATRQGGMSGAGKTLASTGFAGNTLRNLGIQIQDPKTALMLGALDPSGVGGANLAFQTTKRVARAADDALARRGPAAAADGKGADRLSAGVRRVLSGQTAEAGARGGAMSRQRVGLSTLATMARSGTDPKSVAAKAAELGIGPEKVAEVLRLFGPA